MFLANTDSVTVRRSGIGTPHIGKFIYLLTRKSGSLLFSKGLPEHVPSLEVEVCVQCKYDTNHTSNSCPLTDFPYETFRTIHLELATLLTGWSYASLVNNCNRASWMVVGIVSIVFLFWHYDITFCHRFQHINIHIWESIKPSLGEYICNIRVASHTDACPSQIIR